MNKSADSPDFDQNISLEEIPNPNQDRDSDPTPARVIAVVNQKGGVGKTTTAINLAVALALEGLPTLLIDCDPQANTTGGLGFGRDETRPSIYDLLMSEPPGGPTQEHRLPPVTPEPAVSGQATLAEVTFATGIDNLSIIPGSKNLIGANLELVGLERREFRLRDAIAPARSQYPFIVLDCPPALDLLTLNALVAADGLLVPMQAEYFALEGISELMNTLDRVSQAFNPALSLTRRPAHDVRRPHQPLAAGHREPQGVSSGKSSSRPRSRATSALRRHPAMANPSRSTTHARAVPRHTRSLHSNCSHARASKARR